MKPHTFYILSQAELHKTTSFIASQTFTARTWQHLHQEVKKQNHKKKEE